MIICEGCHEWIADGGCNAGCGPDCYCAVPVHICARCDISDYGANDEADFIRQECDHAQAASR